MLQIEIGERAKCIKTKIGPASYGSFAGSTTNHRARSGVWKDWERGVSSLQETCGLCTKVSLFIFIYLYKYIVIYY